MDTTDDLTLSYRGAPLKPSLFGRIRHESDSPSLCGHLPPTSPHALTFPLSARKWYVVGKDNCPLQRLSPKRSQKLISLQKKPTSSDLPSWLLRKNFYTARDRLDRYKRVNVQQVPYTVHLLWNLVSNLEPSGFDRGLVVILTTV
ncbi:hypothetical protein AVEN_225863-1 [Araneus ventricosus]|uniref:Uncharacterized protein n=1 Tax=Araneus ventricosus TaxID=182803 RepID=A0A4Y2BAV1_ARAVE|nr:hypothetical protein AVEN_225863-1 [Araneus ventricosus]